MYELMPTIEATFPEQAIRGFATLMTHVCRLYTCGESSSVTESEGHELAESALYVLGYAEGSEQQT
ncbi:MAG: hypothetical protein Q4B54_11730, partial [Coriobacteriales bacterium]|nr:hypothetical protein [Coriobacteriales bacterium]